MVQQTRPPQQNRMTGDATPKVEETKPAIVLRHASPRVNIRIPAEPVSVLNLEGSFNEGASGVIKNLRKRLVAQQTIPILTERLNKQIDFIISILSERVLQQTPAKTIRKMRTVSAESCAAGMQCSLDICANNKNISLSKACEQGMLAVQASRRERLAPVKDEFARTVKKQLVSFLADRNLIRKALRQASPEIKDPEITSDIKVLDEIIQQTDDLLKAQEFQNKIIDGIVLRSADLYTEILEGFDRQHIKSELQKQVTDPASILGQKILAAAKTQSSKDPISKEELNALVQKVIIAESTKVAKVSVASFKQDLVEAGTLAVLSGLAEVRRILKNDQEKLPALPNILNERREAKNVVLIELGYELPKNMEAIFLNSVLLEPENEARASRVKRIIARDGRVWLCEGLINPRSGDFEIKHSEEIYLNEFKDLRFVMNF